MANNILYQFSKSASGKVSVHPTLDLNIDIQKMMIIQPFLGLVVLIVFSPRFVPREPFDKSSSVPAIYFHVHIEFRHIRFRKSKWYIDGLQ